MHQCAEIGRGMRHKYPHQLQHTVPVIKQPGSSMPNNAKDIELHPQNGCLNPSPNQTNTQKVGH